VRALLLFLARQEGFRNFALRFAFFRNAAARFVAGESLDDAIRAVRLANQQGMLGTLDFLGEDTIAPEDADTACVQVFHTLDRIREERVNCNISVKLTQLGLNLSSDLAFQNLRRIVMHARDTGNFVHVDMEGSRYTRSTLDLVSRAHEESGNVGAVIQAYLRRSEQDVVAMMAKRIRTRLVKGAYLEPDSIAFRKKRDTDANYAKLMKMLLAGETYNAVATHDEAMIQAAKGFVQSENIANNRFEFQMLYGIRRDLQFRLAREGYRVRVYIPYGQKWYPYFMRRMAERPANVAFIMRNLFRK